MRPRTTLVAMFFLCGGIACSGARVTLGPGDGGADATTATDLPVVAVDLPVVAVDLPVVAVDLPVVAVDRPTPLDLPVAVDRPDPVDVSVAVDRGTPVDVAIPPDAGSTYPVGSYGSSVGRLLRPFTLTACNPDAAWQFDGPDFFTSQLTVISIAAAWSVPSQREASQVQAQIVDHYAGRGVRFVQVLVQNADASPISPSTCRAWVSRYGITFPELMDPMFITQPFVPMTAFPGTVIVDRCARIRWREYGAESGLTSLRAAIDEVLADPRYPSCPSVE